MGLDIKLSNKSKALLGFSETTSELPKKKRSCAKMPETRGSSELNKWTATRCHRLLRPLISQIASLHKELAWPSNEVAGCQANELRIEDNILSSAAKTKGNLGRVKSKFTYSSRPSKQHQLQVGKARKAPAACSLSKAATSEAFVCSETAMPTPIARKIRNHQLSSPVALSPCPKPIAQKGRLRSTQVPAKASTSTAMRSSANGELARLRSKMSPTTFSIFDSILRTFESLLRATAEPANYSLSRKSLFSMCLRKVPAYISGRQQWEREDAEARGEKATFNPSEVSFGIYSELENMGAYEGYMHLRAVARAHAVQIIVEAVHEGLLDASFVGIIANLCVSYKATSEADQILESVTNLECSKPPAQIADFGNDRAMESLRLLIAYGDATKRESFALEAISRLLESDRLPHDWLLSDCWRSVWSMAVRVLCRKTACERTITFAITTLSILCLKSGPKPLATVTSSAKNMAIELADSSQKALLAAISPLATILVIGQEAISLAFNSTTQHRISAVRQRIRVILHCCIAGLRMKRGARQRSCIFLLLLTLHLSECNNSDGQHQPDAGEAEFQLRQMWQEPRSSQETAQQYDMAVALIGSIAQCCGRGSTIPASRYLNQLCERVQKLEFEGGRFKALEADGAFYLAARTNDLRDLAFAETLDSSRTLDASKKTHQETEKMIQDAPESLTNMFTGYRWEEGISEWVIKSPPTSTQQSRISAAAIHGSGSGQKNQRAVGVDRVAAKQKVSRPANYSAQANPARACLADGSPRKATLGKVEVENPRCASLAVIPCSLSGAGRKIGTSHGQGWGLKVKPSFRELPVSISTSSSRSIDNPQFSGMTDERENPAKRRRTTTGLPARENDDQVPARQRVRRESSDPSLVCANRKRRRWTCGPTEQSSDDELCL